MSAYKYIVDNGKNKAWFFVYCQCHEALEMKCLKAIEEAKHLYKQCLKIHGQPMVAIHAFGVFGGLKESEQLTIDRAKTLKETFNNADGGLYKFVYKLQKTSAKSKA